MALAGGCDDSRHSDVNCHVLPDRGANHTRATPIAQLPNHAANRNQPARIKARLADSAGAVPTLSSVHCSLNMCEKSASPCKRKWQERNAQCLQVALSVGSLRCRKRPESRVERTRRGHRKSGIHGPDWEPTGTRQCARASPDELDTAIR